MIINRKIHICIDARMVNHSGIGVYIKYIINGLLIDKRFNVTLLGSRIKIQLNFNSPNIFSIIEFDSPIYSILEQIAYPFVIPSCDIFWSPHYNAPLFPIKAKKRLVTIHDVYHLAFKNDLSFLQKLYSNFIINFTLKKANQIITVSNFSKFEIEKYCGKKYSSKISVIYNGVDSKKFNIQFRLKTSEKFILYVGNIKKHKNILNALLAFEILLQKYDDLHFYIVGKKEGFINGSDILLNSIVNKLERKIHFIGWVSENDLISYYSKASVFLFPSMYEGFGLPPLEAMSCGCPTVVSNSASIPEICGDASIYFDPNSITEIASSIEKVLDSEKVRDNLINKGLNQVVKFDWTQSIQKHLNICLKL